MKKLLAYQLSGQTIGVDITTWDSDDLNGNKPFKHIKDGESIPTNYVEISSIENWSNFGGEILGDNEINKQIAILVGELGFNNLDAGQLLILSGTTEALMFGSEYNYIENTEPLVTFSTDYVDYIDYDVILVGGTYRIAWSYVWSHDSASNNFESRIQINSDTLNEYFIEPNESGGSGVGGTDQRRVISQFSVRTLEAGIHTLKMQVATESSGSESSIYNGNFEIYRVG